MTQEEIVKLSIFFARAVARLHAEVKGLHAVIREIRENDSSLDAVDAAQIQIDALQEFYEALERLSPEIAAWMDNRTQRDFDTEGDEGKRFLD